MEINEHTTEPLIIRYLHNKAGREGVSVSTTFELTSRCNFRCKMCYVCNEDCEKNKSEELTKEEWFKIAEQAKQDGVLFILLTGGEPLIRTDFCEIYEHLSKMGFVLSINTNGSLLTEKHFDLFKKYPPNRVNLSLYGTSDEVYKSFCGVPAYKKVLNNILKLKEMKIPLVINCSLTPRNECDYETIKAFCAENDLILRTASYMFPASRFLRNSERFTAFDAGKYRVITDRDKLIPEIFAERVNRIMHGIETTGDCPVDTEGTGIKCRAGSSSSWVTWNGKMSFCGMVPAEAECDVIALGFHDAWLKTIKRAKSVVLPAKCSRCKYSHMCSICAASAFCETGKFDCVPEYVCEMSKSAVKFYSEYFKGELSDEIKR